MSGDTNDRREELMDRLSIELQPEPADRRAAPPPMPDDNMAAFRAQTVSFGVVASRWLEAAFQVRPEEQRKVLLLLLYCMCVIASGFVVGRTVATSLFLKRIDPAYLPLTYVGTSGIVSIATFAYTKVAGRARLDRVIQVTMGALVAATVAFRLLLEAWPASLPLMGSLFVFVELGATLAIIQFWTFANETFTAREGKRLFSLIGAGGPLASILFGAFVRSTASALGAPNLLLVMAGLFLACMLVVSRLGHAQERPVARTERGRTAVAARPEGLRSKIAAVLRSRHLVAIAAFVMALSPVVVIIDYQWMMVARTTYAQDENALAAYFGSFYMYTGLVAFVFQFFLAGRLLQRYGIALGLLLLPVALLVSSGGVAVLMGGGLALAVATLAKGSDTIIRYSVTNASTELLYQPVPQQLRSKAKTIIDGTLRPFVYALSGLLILALGRILDTRQLSYVVLVLLMGVIFLARRAYKGYTASLAETIRRRRLDLRESVLPVEDTTLRAVEKALADDDELRAYHALELLPFVPEWNWNPKVAKLLGAKRAGLRQRALEHLGRSEDPSYAPAIRELFHDPDPEVNAAALRAFCAVAGPAQSVEVTPFLRDPDAAVRAAAVTALIRHGGLDGILLSAEALKGMLVHEEPRMRGAAAGVLEAIEVKHFYQPLEPLLDDPDTQVQLKAIEAAGAMQSRALVPALLRKLGSTKTARTAAEALAAYGDGIAPALASCLAGESAELRSRLYVPRVLSAIGTQVCLDALMQHIEAQEEDVRHRVVHAIEALVAAHPGHVVESKRVKEVCRGEIRGYFQTAIVLHELDGTVERKLLGEALDHQASRAAARVMSLLAVLWPDKPMRSIARCLASNDAAMQGNALELLDNLIEADFKRALLAMLESGSWERKATFAGDTYADLAHNAAEAWLGLLLSNGVGWVAACAAHQIGASKAIGQATSLEAALDTHDPIVREAALWSLERILPPDRFAALTVQSGPSAPANDGASS